MTDEFKYPLQLANAFFVSFQFTRAPAVPANTGFEFLIEMRVHTDKLPKRLQIDVKLETREHEPLWILAELVGLFDLVEGQPEPSEGLIRDFINDRALFMLFPLIRDEIRRMSVSMGMSPINIRVPYYFGFDGVSAESMEEGVLRV